MLGQQSKGGAQLLGLNPLCRSWERCDSMGSLMPRAHLRPPDSHNTGLGSAAISACQGGPGAEALGEFPAQLSTSSQKAATMEWAGEGWGEAGWQQSALRTNSWVCLFREVQDTDSESVVPRPASASLGNLLQMSLLGPHPTSTESKILT